MAKRKSYDDKFRASAVVMLQAQGYPANKYKLEEVAKHLGVPSRTLRRWFTGTNGKPPDDIVREEKRALADRLEALAHKLVDTAFKIADDTDEVSIQQVVTSLGIVIDKNQLLKGEPTDRTEVIDNATRAERINAILERGRTRRAGQPDSGEYVQ